MWTGLAVAGGAIGGALIGANASGNAADTQAGATGKAVAEGGRQYNQTREDLAPYRGAGTAALTRLRSMLGLGAEGSGAIDESDPRYQAIVQRIKDENDAQHREKYGFNWWGDQRSGWGDPASRATQEKMLGDTARQVFQSQYGSNTPASSEDSPLLRKFSKSDLESDVPYNAGLEFGLDEGRKAIERRSAASGGYDSGGTLKALTRFGNDYGTTKAEGAYGRFRDFQDSQYGKLAGVAGMGSGATNVGVAAGSANASNLANLYTGQGNAAAASQIAQGNAVSGGLNTLAGYANQQALLRQLSAGGQRTTTPDPVDV